MLKNGNKTTKDVRLGAARVRAIYQGSTPVYPAIIGSDSGAEYGSWIYSEAVRARNITPWIQDIYQNNTRSAKHYGTAEVISEDATISQQHSAWSYPANSATRSRTITPVYTFVDTVKYGTPTTASENATATDYGNWAYNWITTGNSTRTRSVTYRWSDGATNPGAAQTEAGGTRYLVPAGISGSINAGGGGSVTMTATSHDYWPNTSGTLIQSAAITGITAGATNGFSASVSGSTITVTRGANLTTGVITGNVDFSRSGFVSASGTGNNPNVTQAANSYTTATEQEGYWNAYCAANYYYTDYQKLRTRYDWATGHKTYGDWYNGTARAQRIEGNCGWVRAWTGWARTGSLCGSNGTGSYSCDGTYTVKYNQMVRYYQFPDGSGRTDTQYGVDGIASRIQVEGSCGYTASKTITLELMFSVNFMTTFQDTLTIILSNNQGYSKELYNGSFMEEWLMVPLSIPSISVPVGDLSIRVGYKRRSTTTIISSSYNFNSTNGNTFGPYNIKFEQ